MSNLFSFTWFFLLALSIVFIFFNWLWALAIFILSCLPLVLWTQTPEGRAEIAKQEAEKKAVQQREEAEAKRIELETASLYKELEINFQRLSEDPTDDDALDSILDGLGNLNEDQIKPLINSTILPLLRVKPLDKRVQSTVLLCAQKAIVRPVSSNPSPSQLFYDAALEILQDNPEEIALKQYTLEVGRWHYSIIRPDGKVTIYDEQSIQNDILVRTK